MSDADIANALDLGELRGAFLALKHAQDKDFFQHNLAEILKFAETSKPTLLFQTYLKMLLTYSQRRSKLESEKFNQIVEQLNPQKEMATVFKSIFDVAEEKATKKGLREGKKEGKKEGKREGIAIAEAKAEELRRKAIVELIKTTNFDDKQIAKIMSVTIATVKAIRSELTNTSN